MGNREYVTRMVTSYLETLSKKAVFFKQQEISTADIEEIYNNLPNKDTVKLFFTSMPCLI